MVYIKKLWYWITTPYRKYKEHQEFKKRMKELRERDPFIYK
jgi:hypothetical protein